ncbi:Endonuclease/exonuclease/phosphatase [Lineolata rhizophorae]|uniref:Endonuclease/exonuclease/phosphatase n=1 Tax=Lineolata rhizophorae TaxID=578093 RepID=A0A6A6NN45_9PEZI|nr:Endonuclease/exonuclease/phosphatase [Lineolata rhizophorae]
MALRITTWNVNGIRNPFAHPPWRDRRAFDAMFAVLDADVVVMQELKIQAKDLRDDMVLVPGWDCFFSLPKHKKGYSGVAIYTRQASCAPIRAEEGLLGVLTPPGASRPYRELPPAQSIGGYPTAAQTEALGADPAQLDAEGRCVAVEFPAFVLLGVYAPANSNGLRDGFRHGFLRALDARVRNLARAGKNVVLAGDLNVARAEVDTARAAEMLRKEGLTHDGYMASPNRRLFNQLLEGGEVAGERDAGREDAVLWDVVRDGFHPGRRGMFTHWEQKINARPGNFGSRIDYVLSSVAMKDWWADANIQEGLMVGIPRVVHTRFATPALRAWLTRPSFSGLRPLPRLRRPEASRHLQRRAAAPSRHHEPARHVRGRGAPSRLVPKGHAFAFRPLAARVRPAAQHQGHVSKAALGFERGADRSSSPARAHGERRGPQRRERRV